MHDNELRRKLLEIEYNNLSEKVERLNDFLFSDNVRNNCDEAEQAILIMQYHAMTTYQGILALRLALYEEVK